MIFKVFQPKPFCDYKQQSLNCDMNGMLEIELTKKFDKV